MLLVTCLAAQGEKYNPITQKQADSAWIHERLAPHKTPLMVTSANFALAGTQGLGCAPTTWGPGNIALSKYATALASQHQGVTPLFHGCAYNRAVQKLL